MSDNVTDPLPGVLDPLTNLHNDPKDSKRYVTTRSQSLEFHSFKKMYNDLYCFENLVLGHPFMERLENAENHCKASN